MAVVLLTLFGWGTILVCREFVIEAYVTIQGLTGEVISDGG